MGNTKIGKGGSRKHGRNSEKCKIYKLENRREKNKKRKLLKELKKQPNNENIKEALKKLGA